jgi:hypothetical protein
VQIEEQEPELDATAADAVEDGVAVGADPAIAAEGNHLEELDQEAAGQCREQDSAVHSRRLLGQVHCSRLHEDCMELNRENHLDHLVHDFPFLDRVHHYEALVDYNEIDDTAGNQLADPLEEVGEAEEVDSCIDLQPSHQLANGRYFS